jgi:hypothetical protein
MEVSCLDAYFFSLAISRYAYLRVVHELNTFGFQSFNRYPGVLKIFFRFLQPTLLLFQLLSEPHSLICKLFEGARIHFLPLA